MINKSQSISVRLSQEDYTYLMKINQNGAVTQSEKVRELIHMAREAVGSESFTRSYISSTGAMASYKAKYKYLSKQRSVLLEAMFEFMTEAAAVIQSTPESEEYSEVLEASAIPAFEQLLETIVPALVDDESLIINQDQTKQVKQRLISKLKNNKRNI